MVEFRSDVTIDDQNNIPANPGSDSDNVECGYIDSDALPSKNFIVIGPTLIFLKQDAEKLILPDSLPQPIFHPPTPNPCA
ncbi:MAG: hypothetical protein AB1489_38490 [Acidobacteriota bacterium]